MHRLDLGVSIPPDTAHAVSVSLPKWKHNVGYEEGDERVVQAMQTGYPRFFIHKSVSALATDVVVKHSQSNRQAVLFPTAKAAQRCFQFVLQRAAPELHPCISILHLALDYSRELSPLLKKLNPSVTAVLLPAATYALAKQYWQHAGEGVSSRRAEFCHELFKEGLLVPSPLSPQQTNPQTPARAVRAPRRYQRSDSHDPTPTPMASQRDKPADNIESLKFLEERFGRNLDMSLVDRARFAICRRIVGTANSRSVDCNPTGDNNKYSPVGRGVERIQEDDVYLFPTGMNAIFTAHRVLLAARGELESINFGFPYVDTLKILQKFGPGCLFYGHASAEELDDLQRRLEAGQRFLALFCEFPGNPLLTSPDLQRIRRLARQYDFAVVVDETIGTFANVNVLHAADIVVSSLTKIFSGDANVMGGSMILNPDSPYYGSLRSATEYCYEDTFWPEDAIFMERNSRDFLSRVKRINTNAEALCDILIGHPLVESVYYPKHNHSKKHYDACRRRNGGYGGLLSIVFKQAQHARVFHDALCIAKGPSLGTNFTLCSPYVILAHFTELDWAQQLGVDAHLIRVSVGLESSTDLQAAFSAALRIVEDVHNPTSISL